MSRLLWRSSRRYLMRHPWQFGLSVLGVALGVAVVVSVDLANASATRAFELSTEAVTGRTTHQIVGGDAGVPEEVYRRLRVEAGIRRSAPVVEGHVGWGGDPGRRMRLLGVDPLAEAPIRPWLAALPGAGGEDPESDGLPRAGADLVLGPLLTRAGAILMTAASADELGLSPGDRLNVTVEGEPVELELVGLIRPRSDLARAALRDLLVADIATAQDLLGARGTLSRIDLVLPADPTVVDDVRGRISESLTLVEAGARSRSTLEMTRAFRLNLSAMSLLALVCGTFLIYNTMTFSVVQRRGLIGALRTLGVTRGQVFAGVLAEAALVGCIGTAIGLAGGIGLGNGLVRLVTRTINDLYFALEVRELAIQPAVLLRGAALGLGATVLAALAPAWEATAAAPRTVLTRSAEESRARQALPWVSLAGVVILGIGVALLGAGSRALLVSFAGLFGLILGFALLTPAATLLLARLAWRPSRAAFGLLGGMAARGVSANLSRTAVAIAALMVAVSVIIGVGVMVGSFRGTLEHWLDYTLQADLYVSPAERSDDVLAGVPELRRRLRDDPGVERVQTVRSVRLDTAAGGIALLVVDMPPAGRSAYRIIQGDPDRAWEAWSAGGVLVSEPFAWRAGVGPGDELTLPTDAGQSAFAVGGVFASYASDQGVVMMSRDTYERHWRDRQVSGASIYLAAGADEGRVAGRVRDSLGAEQEIVVRTHGTIRRESLRIFDRTFLITGVLRLLVTLVAFVGVLSALMAMQLERARELGVLRATGLTPRQVLGLVTAQTGLLGLFAGLLSLPVGLVLAWVMIHVINRRSFGWSLSMEVAPEILFQAVLVAVVAALLAGLYPGYRMSRTPPARALREE